MKKSTQNWLFALVLALPMIVFYAAHYLHHDASLTATGFITYDNVSYVAYAKEYLDRDHFSLFYSNPVNDSGNYPAIYFQPQILLLALLLWIGFGPGFAIVFFNCVGTILSFRMAIAIYDRLYPSSANRRLFIWLFCWGGGLLALAGIPVAATKSIANLDFLDRMFFIDPAWGWWGLNFGRGHFNSTEGYFHFLFLAGMFCILKKNWIIALVVALLVSLSHPFTGIEFLAIVFCWSVVEKLIRPANVPWKFVAGVALLLAFHIFYYLFYLAQFPEHRSVSGQYSLNWRLRFFNMIPAYFIVALLALLSFFKWKKTFLGSSYNRLFLCWFLVAFALANHELFMKPMQPLHFTRGYVWTSLYLLGLPALHFLFGNERLRKYRLSLVLFVALMLSDNFLWIFNNIRLPVSSPSTGHISSGQQKLLQLIKDHSDNNTLIIGRDEILPYLSTVYSKAYPWISHPFTTPFANKKAAAYSDFIRNNTIDSSWRNRELIFIFRKNDLEEFQRSRSLAFPVETLANTSSYVILKAKIPGTQAYPVTK